MGDEATAQAVMWDRRGGVGWVQLNRPGSRNALNRATRRGLVTAFEEFEDDPEVRVVVLIGQGPAFCAGADLKETSTVSGHRLQDPGTPVAAPVLACSRPVIAAVNGAAVGGGFELALAADLRVASASAFFQLTELRIGSLPGSGGTQRLFAALPSAVAWRMLASGSRLEAADAERYGLVSDVFADETFAADVEDLAQRVAGAAPLSLRAAKIAARAMTEDRLTTGLSLERTLFSMLATSEDRDEGRAAFREKRPPEFRGR